MDTHTLTHTHTHTHSRPATSFLWFTSPWKTFKFIIWKYYKWHIIGTIVVILLVVIIIIFVYTAPVRYMAISVCMYVHVHRCDLHFTRTRLYGNKDSFVINALGYIVYPEIWLLFVCSFTPEHFDDSNHKPHSSWMRLIKVEWLINFFRNWLIDFDCVINFRSVQQANRIN